MTPSQPTSSSSPPPILGVEGVTKEFGAVRALDDVSFSILPGEVRGLIGENGAGKSTLMRILSGLERPSRGQVLFNARPVELRSAHHALDLGIVMIHQELNLIDELSIADNIFLGREETRLGLIRESRQLAEAARIIESVGLQASPDTKVRHLSIAQKQMVEIAKAVSRRAKVLIMDEPTAVLTGRETRVLFQLIADLKSRGVAIVYISHILQEVLSVSDRITVLRDGKVVASLTPAEAGDGHAGQARLASLMVGRPMQDHFPKRRVLSVEGKGDIALEVRNLSVEGLLENISFSIRKGEILGFAGLIGAGRTEMAETIVGLRRQSTGELFMEGRPIRVRSCQDAVREGIGYLSEDRRGTGLVVPMGIAENTTMVSLKRYCHPFISTKQEDDATRSYVESLAIKIGGPRDAVATLSGGNQQKVAVAKWLEISPRVLILDEPTRGVDIGAKEEIYRLIQSLTLKGMACILISSEINEVLGLSHRIAVMRAGSIAGFLDSETATEETVMHLASGVGGKSF